MERVRFLENAFLIALRDLQEMEEAQEREKPEYMEKQFRDLALTITYCRNNEWQRHHAVSHS